MKPFRLFSYIAVSVCLVVITYFAIATAQTLPQHEDEVSWFFHTNFFELLFLKTDTSSSDWLSYESFDHPQISKYIFGAFLWIRDREVFQKRDALEREWGRWDFYVNPKIKTTGSVVFKPYILNMRYVNVVMTMSTLILLFLLMYVYGGGIYGSLLLVMMLGTNSLFLSVMLRATSDSHVLFFMVASLYTYIRFKIHKKTYWFTLSMLSAAFAVSSKLTGMIIVFSIACYEVIGIPVHPAWWKPIVKRLCLIVLFVGWVWWIINPALYANPLKNSLEYLSFRNRVSIQLQNANPTERLVFIGDKTHAVWCTLIAVRCDSMYPKGQISKFVILNITLLVLGIWQLAKRAMNKHTPDKHLMLGLFVVFTIVYSTIYIPLRWDRYFVPIQICVYILQTIGSMFVWEHGKVVYGYVRKTPRIPRGFFDKTS